MKIQKVDVNSIDQKAYRSQKNVRRIKSVKGGFEKIVIATDADADGSHIRALLCAFFETYLPEFRDKLSILQTPVMIFSKNNKISSWKYSLEDKTEHKGTCTYMKGLGSWDAEDLKQVVKTDGLSKMIETIDYEGTTGQDLIDDWLGNDSEPRKKYILKNDFSIAKV